jgi:hypothetical protein
LTYGRNSQVLVWDTFTWKEVCELGDHSGAVFSLAFSPDGRALATGCWDTKVRLWEVASWTKRNQFEGHCGRVYQTAFSPDGRILASGGQDGRVYLWDVTGLAAAGVRPLVPLPAEKREELWKALPGRDGARAYQAVCELSTAPRQAVHLVKERLRPATVGSAQVGRLLADLDADSYAVREKATAALAQLGKAAQPALRQTLNNPLSAEVHRRVSDLLERLEGEPPPPEMLLAVRATEILEILGSPEAREVLGVLAAGAPGAPLTEQAKASLGRLATRLPPGEQAWKPSGH